MKPLLTSLISALALQTVTHWEQPGLSSYSPTRLLFGRLSAQIALPPFQFPQSLASGALVYILPLNIPSLLPLQMFVINRTIMLFPVGP